MRRDFHFRSCQEHDRPAMDIGRLYTYSPDRSAYADNRSRVPPVQEAEYEAAPREEEVRRARATESAVEGELLARERNARTQSTLDYLHTRQYQSGSAEALRADTRQTLSNRNRQALGLYRDNTRPEPRQVFTTGRAVDAFV